MRTGLWVAYICWLVFFGALAWIATLALASALFGAYHVCLFEEQSATTETYSLSVQLTLLTALFVLCALGPALARRSGLHLALVPVGVYALASTGLLVAAGIIGDQPCEGSFLG